MVASEPRINIDPTYGNTVVPSELNACANVRRLCAVDGGPSREINGFATTCTIVMPDASTNNARRNAANTPDADAGMNSTHPEVIVNRPITAVRM